MKTYSKKGYKKLLIRQYINTGMSFKKFEEEITKIEPTYMEFELLNSHKQPRLHIGMLLIYVDGKREIIKTCE